MQPSIFKYSFGFKLFYFCLAFTALTAVITEPFKVIFTDVLLWLNSGQREAAYQFCLSKTVSEPHYFLCLHCSGRSTPKLLRTDGFRRALGQDGPPDLPHSSPSLLHRVLAKSRRKSCPHFASQSTESGSINTAFQPD